MVRAVIRGVGFAVPDWVVDNAYFTEEAGLDTSDEWITQRTGIKTRHLLAPDEDPLDLAREAVRRALDDAGKALEEIDVLIVSSSVAYCPVSETAAHLKRALGIADHREAIDVKAACAGAIQGLRLASLLIEAGEARTVLFVALEALSRSLNWQDRSTCVLFGDGAGAIVLETCEDGRGVLATVMRCYSDLTDVATIRAGGTARPLTPENVGTPEQFIYMEGRAVFKSALQCLPRAMEEALAKAGLSADELDWFIPHQANRRIIVPVGEALGLPPEKVIINVDRYGNTSSASIPIALAELVASGRVRAGQLLGLAAIGGGLHYGAAVVRF